MAQQQQINEQQQQQTANNLNQNDGDNINENNVPSISSMDADSDLNDEANNSTSTRAEDSTNKQPTTTAKNSKSNSESNAQYVVNPNANNSNEIKNIIEETFGKIKSEKIQIHESTELEAKQGVLETINEESVHQQRQAEIEQERMEFMRGREHTNEINQAIEAAHAKARAEAAAENNGKHAHILDDFSNKSSEFTTPPWDSTKSDNKSDSKPINDITST